MNYKLIPQNPQCTNAYALIKLHKNNNPARIIVPYNSNPIEPVSFFLADLFKLYLNNKFDN